MKLRALSIACLIVFAAVSVFSQSRGATPDPWLGTWAQKGDAQPGRTSTLKLEPVAGGVKITLNVGAPNQSQVSAKFDGSDVVINPASPNDTVALTRIDEHTFEAVTKSNGQTTATHRISVSPDGKTLTQTQTVGTAKTVSTYNRVP
jgi:hypothetical protein